MSHPVSVKSESSFQAHFQQCQFFFSFKNQPLKIHSINLNKIHLHTTTSTSIYFAGSYFIYKIFDQQYKISWFVINELYVQWVYTVYWVQGNWSTKSKCSYYVNVLVTVNSLKHTIPYSEEDCFFISITFWCLLYFNLNLQCWTCVTPFWQSVITQTLRSDYNTTGFATLLFAAICCISIPSHSCNSIWLM